MLIVRTRLTFFPPNYLTFESVVMSTQLSFYSTSIIHRQTISWLIYFWNNGVGNNDSLFLYIPVVEVELQCGAIELSTGPTWLITSKGKLQRHAWRFQCCTASMQSTATRTFLALLSTLIILDSARPETRTSPAKWEQRLRGSWLAWASDGHSHRLLLSVVIQDGEDAMRAMGKFRPSSIRWGQLKFKAGRYD